MRERDSRKPLPAPPSAVMLIVPPDVCARKRSLLKTIIASRLYLVSFSSGLLAVRLKIHHPIHPRENLIRNDNFNKDGVYQIFVKNVI